MNNNRSFNNEVLPTPEFTTSVNEVAMLYSSASFVRTSENSNLEISIPIGTDIDPGITWYSTDAYLSDNTFNLTRPISEISYPGAKDTLILKDLKFLHDVFVQYKLEKSDGTNFKNRRELRCILTREDGVTPYDASFFANQQPDSGQHDYIQLRGHIQHNLNDLARLKFNIAQDNQYSDQTDSKLTIFRISWNILGLYTSPET